VPGVADRLNPAACPQLVRGALDMLVPNDLSRRHEAAAKAGDTVSLELVVAAWATSGASTAGSRGPPVLRAVRARGCRARGVR
jgi:hypothetical protein